MTINEKGATLPEGFVKWVDMERIYLDRIKGKVFLRVKLKEERVKVIIEGYNIFQKILASLQKGNTLSYPLSGTNANIDELYNFIKRCRTEKSSEKEK